MKLYHIKTKITIILLCLDMLDSHPTHAIETLRLMFHIANAEVIE